MVVRNQLHRIIGGPKRGGHRTQQWAVDERRAHGVGIFRQLSPYLGNINGLKGVEIGPGDNLEVARQCINAGATRMYVVERFARMPEAHPEITVVRQAIEKTSLPDQVGFAYSNDVLEHVYDVDGTMRAIFHSLTPGGLFVSSIDLRGHNVFNRPGRSLDFLCCPDWLWSAMFSHVVTTNRVRVHEFSRAAKHAGFEVLKCEALVSADREYLSAVKVHMLPRFQVLPDEELAALQLLLVVRKPAIA